MKTSTFTNSATLVWKSIGWRKNLPWPTALNEAYFWRTGSPDHQIMDEFIKVGDTITNILKLLRSNTSI
jgi:hypothetical protein